MNKFSIDKVLKRTDLYYKLCFALSGEIIAYHVGPKFEKFDLSHIGSGENNMILGPGMYFLTSKSSALVYSKYHSYPYLYTVSINSNGLYDPIKGEPLHLRKKMLSLRQHVAKSLGMTLKEFDFKGMPLTHGNAGIGDFVYHIGAEKTRSFFKRIGVTGIYEHISPDVLEISVYDLSTVKILSVESVGDEEEYERRKIENKKENSICSFCKKQIYNPFIEPYSNMNYSQLSDLMQEHMDHC